MARVRSRWRVALGGAQLDPAMRVAELAVQDVVKLCNALERLTLKSDADWGSVRMIRELSDLLPFC